MKKLLSFIVSIIIIACAIMPIGAIASDNAPTLKSISFNGATIDDEFSPSEYEYTITLANQNETPTLKTYKISGDANIFVTYSYDSSNHQDGIVVKVEHSNGAVYYNFRYSNQGVFEENSDNDLKQVSCNLGEVYPKLNSNDTSYRLYIPSDLTEITISAVANDIWATVDAPSTITLNESQEPVIPITVTASNGESKNYSLKVKRLKKTSEEVKAEMAQPDFESIVYGELLYQKPEFLIGAICAVAGIIIVLIAITVSKRIMIKVGDDDEEDFFE